MQTPLISNYSKPMKGIVPKSVTFVELTIAIYNEIRKTHPGFIPTIDMEFRIHDLWILGPPDLNRMDVEAKWLLPGPMKQLARELAQEVGAQILKAGN